MGSFNDIPEDLLLKIFFLQPMNSLVLLRNVCKLWDQIIGSEYFNQFQHARERTSSYTNKYLLLHGACGSKSTSLVDSDKYIYHDIPIKNYECYGICDGLLCLASTKDCSNPSIILWNPIFRKTLPQLKIKYSQITYMCFGYHDDDYKVIKVVVFPRMYYVCIYSLSTHSWKVIEFDGLISGIHDYDCFKSHWWSLQYTNGRLVNGVAYFAGQYRILSFDLSAEVFREPVIFNYSCDIIIEEHRESLVLIGFVSYGITDGYYSDDDNWGACNPSVVMWVLSESTTDDNSSYAWDEVSLVQLTSNHQLEPVGILNNDELILRSSSPDAIHKHSFLLYNLENPCLQRFTSQEACVTMVEPSSFIRVGGKYEVRRYLKPIHAPSRQSQQPKKKKVALLCNSYAALALDEDI